MVSQKLLDELKTIILEDYMVDLSIPEVAEIADDLVGYFNLLAKIDYREKIKNNNDNNKRTNN